MTTRSGKAPPRGRKRKSSPEESPKTGTKRKQKMAQKSEGSSQASPLHTDGSPVNKTEADTADIKEEDQMEEMKKWSVNPDEPYTMKEPELGHAFIVNNLARDMPGTKKDVEALEAVYTGMGFNVEVFEDCSKDQMDNIMSFMTKEELHEKSNCFMLTVIAHGDQYGRLKSGKEDTCYVWQIDKIKNLEKPLKLDKTKKIVESLNGVNSLRGKPKILLIDACRGGKKLARYDPPSDKNDDEQEEEETGGAKADFYIAYATVPGYITPATPEGGSYFLQSFAKYLKQHYMKHSIDRIFTCVKHDMERIEHGNMKKKQCPEDRSSLRRVLMFSEFYKERREASLRTSHSEVSREIPILKAQLETRKKNAEQQEREMEKMSEEMEKIAKMENPDGKTESLKEMKRRMYKTIKKMKREKNEAISKVPRKIKKALELTCTVRHTTKIGLFFPCMCLLSNDTVLVAGKDEYHVWFIKSYKQEGLKELSEKVPLGVEPHEMTEVELGDRDTVAVSCPGEKSHIQFLDVTELSDMVKKHSVEPSKPRLLHTSGPSLLYFSTLYEDKDQSEKQWSVCTLDCSTGNPRPAKGKKIITKKGCLDDMCCVRDEDKQLLFVTEDKKGVFCYDMQDDDDQFLWRSGELTGMKKKINAVGITTDGRGLIYVCDYNNRCIQVFSESDGQYFGPLKIEGEQELHDPDCIRWCEGTESLIVTHVKDGKNQISVIKVEEILPQTELLNQQFKDLTMRC